MFAMAVALVACAADGVSAPAGTDGAASVPGAAGMLPLVGGSSVDIGAIQAVRPVALWFWAPG
jgi:hypothetical protein